MRALDVAALALVVSMLGCGDDGDSSAGGGGAGDAGSTTTGSTTTGSTTTAGPGGSGPGGTGGQGGGGQGGGTEVACGAAICSGGDACVETHVEPECTDRGEGEMCPEGTEESQCGGAGSPCCCGETPAPAFACEEAPACEGGVPTCACLDPCTGGLGCQDTATPGLLICEALPVP